ncbi:MAG: HNH endonuclease [Bacteroidales bacterium]|nr:HNH endonuclease [Candidatus Scybalousia scybalohippi]
MIKICENCGKEFTTTNKNAKCCCNKCRGENRTKKSLVKKICQYCGKEFFVKKSKEKTAQYCCIECSNKSRSNLVLKICPICGKEFYVSKCLENVSKYCSNKCRGKAKEKQVLKICKTCGKEFSVIKTREETALYCCRQCADEGKHAENNVTCSYCGKEFHMKPYQQFRYRRRLGTFCSVECLSKAKIEGYSGEGNHQFGLKGELNASFKGAEIIQKNHKINDIMVYVPEHPYANTAGRYKKHRLIVEQNYELFDFKYFEKINDTIVLKSDVDVHHKDGNHDNNDINNLMPCTRKEHAKFHFTKIIERDNFGRIIKSQTAVVKQGELLENLEVDNQQPSTPLTKCEGSETNIDTKCSTFRI